jgi:hypothetical protein
MTSEDRVAMPEGLIWDPANVEACRGQLCPVWTPYECGLCGAKGLTPGTSPCYPSRLRSALGLSRAELPSSVPATAPTAPAGPPDPLPSSQSAVPQPSGDLPDPLVGSAPPVDLGPWYRRIALEALSSRRQFEAVGQLHGTRCVDGTYTIHVTMQAPGHPQRESFTEDYPIARPCVSWVTFALAKILQYMKQEG